MQIPLQVQFRNMDRSAALEEAVKERIQKLERFAGDITSCRVTLEAPHKHSAKGKIYHVTIDLRLPGAEIVVNRDPQDAHAHEDVYVALRDAVNAAHRRLQDKVRIKRGKVKAHESPQHGKIVEARPELDYGRIQTPDGRLIYFHRNSLLNATLDGVETGMEVRFSEESGDAGPQATSVHLVGKHHPA